MSPSDSCTLLYLAAWVILSWSLQLVESSHAKQIQRFLPWGHGSVICQTKCFLRLAICTHQVSVTCKSRFTKCQKAFHCNLRGGGANKTQWHYITVHFSHLAETLNQQRTVPWNVQSHTSETTRIVWFHRNVTTEATNTFFLHFRGDHIWYRSAKEETFEKSLTLKDYSNSGNLLLKGNYYNETWQEINYKICGLSWS